MSDKKPIPVRLSEDVIKRLDRASEALHAGNRTAVIKYCLGTFLDYYEQHGWEGLQPDWERIEAETDGRRKPPGIAAEPKEKYTSEK